MRVGSLFSGIGGIELGLERAGGFETVWQVEINQYARGVLNKHWTISPIIDDVKDVITSNLCQIDLLCGGFPCQNISNSGTAKEPPKGLKGAKSGLWFEMDKIISFHKPALVLIENVGALRSRGLDVVLANLDANGYDAEWGIISSGALGLHHLRKRLFVIAAKRGENDGVIGNMFFPRPKREKVPNDKPPILLSKSPTKEQQLRIEALGNCVTPICAEFIGKRINQGQAKSRNVHGNIIACLSEGTWRQYEGMTFLPYDVLPQLKELPPCGIMTHEDDVTVLRQTGVWKHPKCQYRTPTARDYIGLSALSWRTRDVGDKTPTLPDQLGAIADPDWLEWLMGFPEGWTKP
jgi:hypothetical protein